MLQIGETIQTVNTREWLQVVTKLHALGYKMHYMPGMKILITGVPKEGKDESRKN